MKKFKVAISAPYMHQEKNKIENYLKNYNWEPVWIPVKERLEEEDLIKFINQFDGIICGDDRLTANVYDHAKNLKVVVKWGTGIDSINKEEAEKRGIEVCRTPNAFTVPVAESTLALMLSFARNIQFNDRVMKSGDWAKPQGHTLSECTVGLVGFGNIGQAVAKRLLPFQCKILATDIMNKSQEAKNCGVEFVSLDEILEHCHYISLHTDLNSTSHHLINQKSISKMKLSPFIINTARGPLICEEDLILGLEQKKISGAGLDVFEVEPLETSSPLRNMPQVLLSSHNTNSSSHYWNFVHQNSLEMMDAGLRKFL